MGDERKRRVLLLRAAKGVLWLGAVWNFSLWGYAIWRLAASPRLSDAVGDALAFALLGGIGFVVTWLIAAGIRKLAG